MNISKEQQVSLKKKWLQDNQGVSFLSFRRSIQAGSFCCIMVLWSGMWLGIETDGYTHS